MRNRLLINPHRHDDRRVNVRGMFAVLLISARFESAMRDTKFLRVNEGRAQVVQFRGKDSGGMSGTLRKTCMEIPRRR